MRISTFWYCLKQGFRNICRNILFSLASVATISACIFLFCLFFSIVANVQYIVKNAESSVGITVFFDEDLTQERIQEIGQEIEGQSGVTRVTYTSPDEAWAGFKDEYFEGKEELAAGFEDDNPLAGSASYQIFLEDISNQEGFVGYLQSIEGVRSVIYSNIAASGLASFNQMVGLLSLVIVGVLLAVAVFLISNTISVAAAFRREENQIMKLIGAKNFMIRAPFVVEGVILGLLGALLPLAGMYYLYTNAVIYIAEKFSILSGVFSFLPMETIFPYMAAVAMGLGVGIGFIVSFFTIRKHLKV